MTIKIRGELEIDQDRGVIYFHSLEQGITALRICNLPKPIPDPRINGMLDITHMHGATWK
jgi:hypothetical protein